MEIRILKPDDVSENYVKWYSNKEIVKYSDNQYRCFSLEGQKLYVENCLKNKEIRLWNIRRNTYWKYCFEWDRSIHKRAEITT